MKSPIYKALVILSLFSPIAAHAHISDVALAPLSRGGTHAVKPEISDHQEHLPMQLQQMIKKISSHKYLPSHAPASKQ